MLKRITFEIEIIETLYISLRQITTIDWRSSKEWHTHTRMDDVDYLVEDNTSDNFSNWGELNSRGCVHYLKKVIA